jgi:hypothetical protein
VGAVPSISWDEFATLRLSQFVPAKLVRGLEDWEYVERLWVGEATGFTEWLRLADDPEVLRSMALDLAGLERGTVDAVLKRLGLVLHPAMTRDEVTSTLGEPASVQVFPGAKDRETLTYPAPPSAGYGLSCTVQRTAGLTYLVIMRGDVTGP